MARSSKTASPDADLRRRIDRSISEGRFQNALDLAKQLFKYTPTPEHHDLLLRCYLGRANQLREQGKTRDAATVLEVAAQYVGDEPAARVHFAEELARAGEAARAFQILQSVPEPRPANKVPALAADAAMARGAAGRSLLPDSLHADFDRIRAAFVHAEAGQDDAAREALQAISLQSPFLEWKVLLRGLLAYYAADDGRALDNWSRLDPGRLPARLAAPLRALIDKDFRHAQPPETQLALQRQADRLQGNPALGGLKKIQHAFLQNQGMMPAFREAEHLLPGLKQQYPHLVPRLANCFYWEIIGQGEPHDVTRYQRLFGKPPDDPDFARMRALALESHSDYSFAHQEWKRFEEDIAKDTTRWPRPEADRAQAMVWFRMGQNARKQDDVVRATEKLPPFPFGGFDRERPRRLNPSTEQCLRQAIKLAPDWLDPYVALFEHYRQDGQKRKNAIEVGRELLQRFPDHLPTLEALADLLRQESHFGESAAMLEQAIHANPLNRRLRGHLGDVRRLHGATLTQQGRLDQARSEFEAAVALNEPRFHFPVLTQWAAAEFLAGHAERAEQLLQQAAADEANRPALSAAMYAQSVALKLPKPVKARFEQEFKQQLAGDATVPAAVALAELFARFQIEGFEYFGGKTHVKKVQALVEKTLRLAYTEPQMERLGAALLTLKANRLLKKFAGVWRRMFHQSPYPLLFEIETGLTGDDSRWPIWRLKPLAEKARQLAEKMPPGDRREDVLRRLEARLQQFRDLNPFSSLFDQFMDNFGGPDEGDWEDDEPW